MIVDDEEDILTSFKTFLKDEEIDICVEPFRSSHDALIQFTQVYYDLVIIDIRMPDINGLQLCRLISFDKSTICIYSI
jgi:YesN/AraC family two-component response regulator